jgi:hypothetical protein
MRFWNSGKATFRVGTHRDTLEIIEKTVPNALKLKDPATGQNYPLGAAIVNFPGHMLRKVVLQGEWIDLPDDLSAEVVQRACPALLTEEEAAVELAKPDSKPVADDADKPRGPGRPPKLIKE